MKRNLSIFIGNVLITLAYAFITVPQSIINGGITSFCMSLSRILPLSVSVLVTIMTILIAAACFFTLEFDYFKGSLFCCTCYIILFNVFSSIGWKPNLPTIVSVPISAIFVGIGLFMCINSKATTVGTDTIAVIVHEKAPKIPIATAMYAVNIGVLLLGLSTYGFISLIKGLVFTSIQIFVLNFSLNLRNKIESVKVN